MFACLTYILNLQEESILVQIVLETYDLRAKFCRIISTVKLACTDTLM